MGKPVKAYKVKHLNIVDTTKYMEGDIFITNRSVGILHNGKIKKIGNNNTPNLKDYVKKEEVKSMIDEALKKGGEDGEQV